MENQGEEVIEESKQNKKNKAPVFRTILSVFGTIVTVIVAIISIIILTQKVTNNKASFFGYRIFRVQTGSMIPKYNVGDVILVNQNR